MTTTLLDIAAKEATGWREGDARDDKADKPTELYIPKSDAEDMGTETSEQNVASRLGSRDPGQGYIPAH